MDWKLLLAFVIPMATGLVGYGILTARVEELRGTAARHWDALDSRARGDFVNTLALRVDRLEEGRAELESLVERVAGAKKDAADARAMMEKMLDRELSKCKEVR